MKTPDAYKNVEAEIDRPPLTFQKDRAMVMGAPIQNRTCEVDVSIGIRLRIGRGTFNLRVWGGP